MSRPSAILCLVIFSVLSLSGCGGEAENETEMPAADNESTLAMEKLLQGEGQGREVISSATGLQYVDLKVGEGEPPKPGQICSTHATLWLLDDTRVWSSRDAEPGGEVQPFEFRLSRGGVIPGWDEGVASMRPGGIRRLAVPPELGYGPNGRDPIPPNATLIFEIELLEVRD